MPIRPCVTRTNHLRLRQALAVGALLAGLAYLTWRLLFTLSVSTLWLGLPLLFAEAVALLGTAFFVFESWTLRARSAPPPSRRSWRCAVLVPTYNEPPDIVRPTVLGALSVRATPRPEVWVLDDGGRQWVKEMCEELGANYLCRPAPREHAKAGNLNHALSRISADVLLIVDADHVPLPHALERTLGYFDDPKLAFVQSPQVFFNRSFQHPRRSDDPLLNEQSMFYDVICPGKDRNNAAFWCGSSAVLRREAIESIGGIATETLVEDTHTAMRLHAAGWRSAYHQEALAVGLAPEDVNAYIVQRGRWAAGCFQLLRKDNPLLVRGLTLRQRLHYLASLLHYLEGPQRLVALAVPPLVLLTGTVPLVAAQWLFLTLFLPQFVLVPTAARAMARGRYRLLESERFSLSRAAAYSKAARALVSSRPIPFAVTPKGAGTESDRPALLRVPLAFAAFAAFGIAYQSTAQLLGLPGRLPTFAFAVTAFWATISVVFSTVAVHWAAVIRHRRRAHRFPVRLDAHYRPAGAELPRRLGRVTDLNTFGLALVTAEPLALGAEIDVTVTLDDECATVRGTAVRVEIGKEGATAAGVAFGSIDRATADLIARWCFRHPFGPDLVLDSDGDLAGLQPEVVAA
jgi:cellulose synthase (UDP-forming)